jgi:carboxymethylenebutenolidase
MNYNHIADTHALLDSTEASHTPTRRLALQTAFGLGYAAAAMPLMAQTAVQTSAEGLTTGRVEIDVNGFKVPAYRSAPAGKTNLPVVLVISEIFGVHEYIADVTRRLAREGYLAIAPELFVRQGDPSQFKEIAKLQAEIISKVPDAQVMADLDATMQWAAQNGGNTNRAAITGFCWGGRITWLYAAHNPKVKAGMAWYGRMEGQTNANTPKHPVDLVASLKAPVLGLYGGADTGIPVTSINTMKEALAQAGANGNPAAKASTFVLYPEAPHAFHADYRASYRAGPAADGWTRAVAWLKQHV